MVIDSGANLTTEVTARSGEPSIDRSKMSSSRDDADLRLAG